MRLDRFLCELNLGTRTQVKKEIKAGLVSVNGVTVLRPEEQVREAADLVCYKGQPCVYEEYVYYLLHKPAYSQDPADIPPALPPPSALPPGESSSGMGQDTAEGQIFCCTPHTF